MELNYFRDKLFDLLNDSEGMGIADLNDRKLTVYNGRGAFKKSPPQILLQGNWLEKAGFSAGDKITVKCQQGRLVITKNEPESDNEAENRQT